MLKTEQTQGQTIYQHGLSVQIHLFELLNHLKFESDLSDWRLPNWINDYKTQILSNLHSEEILSAYTLYHDCGKIFCRVVDVEGKIHFPNHAEISKNTYLKATNDVITSNLIGWDMILHQSSSIEIENYCSIWTIKDAMTLLLTSLSEIHSNAKMFGGIDSISFKTKFKQIERRGKQLCKYYFERKT